MLPVLRRLTALEETELITLGRDDFKQMLREYPQAGMAMLIQLSIAWKKLIRKRSYSH